MQMSGRYQGFTLIELMIAIAISAILATAAYPIYASYQARSYRGQAEVVLMQLAVKMAQYYSQTGNYQGIVIRKLLNFDELKRLPYRFELTQVPDNHFLLQAIPDQVQRGRDQGCGILGLGDDNNRTVEGGAGVSACWS